MREKLTSPRCVTCLYVQPQDGKKEIDLAPCGLSRRLHSRVLQWRSPSTSLPRYSMAECRGHFFLAEALAFHTQINTIATDSDIIISFPYTCSDIFVKSLHPNQARRELATSQGHTDGYGHFPSSSMLCLRKASPRPTTLQI